MRGRATPVHATSAAEAAAQRQRQQEQSFDAGFDDAEARARDCVVGGFLVRRERDAIGERRRHFGAMGGDKTRSAGARARASPRATAAKRGDEDGGKNRGGHDERVGPAAEAARCARMRGLILRSSRHACRRHPPHLDRSRDDRLEARKRPHHRGRDRRHRRRSRDRRRSAGVGGASGRCCARRDGFVEQEHARAIGPDRPREGVDA